MFLIHRDFIRSPEEAIRVADYLKKIDSSSVAITSFAMLMQKNKEILQKILTINQCNLIKNWLIEQEN